MASNKRFDELDSIRGLAAVSVMFSHFLIIFPAISASPSARQPKWLEILKYSPLHIWFAGTQAVVTFFILSGFVLSLPFYGPHKPGWARFVVKRIFRVYVPYIVAVVVATALMVAFSRHGIPALSAWVNSVWVAPLTPSLLLGHLSLIGSFPNGSIDPVIWSLVFEMRISLVFPLIMLLVCRADWRVTLCAGFGVSVLSLLALYVSHHYLHSYTDYPRTLEYVLMFIFGALIAKHRTDIIMRYQSIPKIFRLSWLPVAVVFYTYAFLWPDNFYMHLPYANLLMAAIGASMMIVLALASPAVSRLLHLSPLLYMGRISYSFYLFHAIVLLTLLNLLYGHLPIGLILVMTAALAVAVASVSYRVIEAPSMAFGKRLTSTRREAGGASEIEVEGAAGLGTAP